MNHAPDNCTRAYAKHLARYVRDPSTIQARTRDFFGRAPSIKDISGIIEEMNRPMQCVKGIEADPHAARREIDLAQGSEALMRTLWREHRTILNNLAARGRSVTPIERLHHGER